MEKQNLFFALPYPPSVNTYWGFQGSRRFLTKRATEFVAMVKVITRGASVDRALIEVRIDLYPPDRRVRDIDNIIKPTLDALVHAGVMLDDAQVNRLVVSRCEIIKGGRCDVTITIQDPK